MRSALAVASTICLVLALTAGCDSGPAKDQVAYDVCKAQGSSPEPQCRCFAEKMLTTYSKDELRIVDKFLGDMLDLATHKIESVPPATDERIRHPELLSRIHKIGADCHMEP